MHNDFDLSPAPPQKKEEKKVLQDNAVSQNLFAAFPESVFKKLNWHLKSVKLVKQI